MTRMWNRRQLLGAMALAEGAMVLILASHYLVVGTPAGWDTGSYVYQYDIVSLEGVSHVFDNARVLPNAYLRYHVAPPNMRSVSRYDMATALENSPKDSAPRPEAATRNVKTLITETITDARRIYLVPCIISTDTNTPQ
ncbi:MAG: hypothetical protein QXQ81_10515 [Candidatus Thorarchaeota archaeon]